MLVDRDLEQKMPRVFSFPSGLHRARQGRLVKQYNRPDRASPIGYEKPCLRRLAAIKRLHNHVQKVDARSLGLPNRDCKERGACQLTDAPKAIGILHTF